MDDEITFDYICEFFYDAYITKNSWKSKEFFNNDEMIKIATECYPMIDIIWKNRREIAYLFRNRMISPPTCANPECDNYVTFHTSKYMSSCSKKCANTIVANDEDVKNKIKQTNLEKYGYEFTFQSDNIQKKIKKSMVELYGVISPLQNKDIYNKVKQTNIERYGVENISQYKPIKDKKKNTFLEKYGTENPFQAKMIQHKIEKTNIEKYGNVHYSQTKEYKSKVKATSNERYGTDNYSSTEECRKKVVNANLNLYGVDHFKKSHYNHTYTTLFVYDNIMLFEKLLYEYGTYELAELVNCDPSTIYFHAKKYNISLPPRPRSQQEQQLIDLFDQHNINFTCNDRNVIEPLELDFYLSEHNIAIELNGLYWHSEKFGKDKNYHYNKWKSCQDKGVDLYSIFEDDFSDMWLNKILHLCNASKYDKIYARKCEIKEIDGKIAKQFLDENHFQGNKYSSINIGLYYQDYLVSVMSFSNTRNNNDSIVELTRFCNRIDTQVIGGASKILKYFIKNYGDCFNEIISFSDNTYSDGSLYETLGFNVHSYLKPDYKYVVNNKRSHKTNFRKSKIQEKFDLDPEFVKNHTEKELMNMLGIFRIWDCGKKKWAMKI